jgi:hypothetical protein
MIGTPEQPRFARRSSAAERTRQDQINAGSTVRSLNGGSAAGSLVTRPARAYSAPASAQASIERLSGSTIQY